MSSVLFSTLFCRGTDVGSTELYFRPNLRLATMLLQSPDPQQETATSSFPSVCLHLTSYPRILAIRCCVTSANHAARVVGPKGHVVIHFTSLFGLCRLHLCCHFLRISAVTIRSDWPVAGLQSRNCSLVSFFSGKKKKKK
jgi:hypothetical protein